MNETWAATYDEPAEPIAATGRTPQGAVRRLQAMLGEADDGEPLEIVRGQNGDLRIADGPHLIGRVEKN